MIVDPEPDFLLSPGFIAMDGARHQAHRKSVQPVASPRNLTRLEPLIRQRVGEMLDGLPVGETFDWVDRVSIELTTGMLATMFDFQWEERRKLTFWSDIATMSPEQLAERGMTEEDGRAVLLECLDYFTKLWKERANRPRTSEPLAHMRRTTTQDTELGGKKIKKGDKVVLWYVSANRDETAIPRASEFLIDRENKKQHLSFGWGVHFCMGSRLAEMQLRVLWEEIMRRFRFVEVVGEPVRVKSPFVKGFTKLPVRVHPG